MQHSDPIMDGSKGAITTANDVCLLSMSAWVAQVQATMSTSEGMTPMWRTACLPVQKNDL